MQQYDGLPDDVPRKVYYENAVRITLNIRRWTRDPGAARSDRSGGYSQGASPGRAPVPPGMDRWDRNI
jgi:hypothetical protein